MESETTQEKVLRPPADRASRSEGEGRLQGVRKPCYRRNRSFHLLFDDLQFTIVSTSTWHNITNGLHAAVYDSYAAKSSRQREKREVVDVMNDVDGFCQRKRYELESGTYRIGNYRHFWLKDKKKKRNISVLPYDDRCVQNDMKNAIQPNILKQMTDDMMGGLPGCGVLASNKRHQVVARMRVLMNDLTLRYALQGDISKFYDNVDNIISMGIIERQVKDKRTRAVIRQHLFNQKRLAIGDPFSHLIANLNMSVIIRRAKKKYGDRIKIVNFADDFIAFSKDKKTLENLRRDMRILARQMRLHYKPMYVRPIDAKPGKKYNPIIFCGYKFGRGYIHLTQRTKKRYIKARHKERSMGSYQGIIGVADTKHLKLKVQINDNNKGTMSEKIRRPFAGRPMKMETMEGINHTIVDFQKRSSNQKDCDSYYHIQALADGLGLIVYSTGAQKICKYLDTKSRTDIPLRDMKIVHDWSGFYYEGTVYTDAEEEEMIRKQFNIPKSA